MERFPSGTKTRRQPRRSQSKDSDRSRHSVSTHGERPGSLGSLSVVPGWTEAQGRHTASAVEAPVPTPQRQGVCGVHGWLPSERLNRPAGQSAQTPALRGSARSTESVCPGGHRAVRSTQTPSDAYQRGGHATQFDARFTVPGRQMAASATLHIIHPNHQRIIRRSGRTFVLRL